MTERYPIGRTIDIDGWRYRVVAGTRCDGDKVIEFSPPGSSSWYRPPISHMVVLFNCKIEVEENNYGKDGKILSASGKRLLYEAILAGMDYGAEEVAKRIQRQREGRGDREAYWASLLAAEEAQPRR
jgi:hypothetical protein